VFHYEPGALYEIVTHPNFVTTILLEAGETLLDIAAGDTARWMVTEAVSESAGDPRAVVLVKPRMEGLRTNIVLITDRRVYMVEALSQSRPLYAAQIAWSYPATDKTALPGASRFSYRVLPVRGRLPAWAPERVFDDGRAVHVVFPPEARGELAPLFVMTRDGPALANYRVIEAQGRTHYVVDGLFEAAELRLGVRKPLAVRIERIAARAPDDARESAR
jgi:type IV secretion system protein VirB9